MSNPTPGREGTRARGARPRTLAAALALATLAANVGCRKLALIGRPSEPASLRPPRPTDRAPAPKGIDGAFVVLGDALPSAPFTPDRARAVVEEAAELGVRSLIVHATRERRGDCDRGTYSWIPGYPELLGATLDAAAARQMRVFVGLVANAPACSALHDERLAKQTAADSVGVVGSLVAAFGSHPALAGWYVPDEPGLGWETTYPHYRGIVSAVRSRSPLPIVVSPYLARATERFAPEEVASMASRFQRSTGVDIQVWQDSVGAAGVDPGAPRDGAKGGLHAYFAAIAGAIGRDHLWADVELFDCCGSPFTPASGARLATQLLAVGEDVASARFAWLPQRHLGIADPRHEPESPRLRAAYLAMTARRGELVMPARYSWKTPPDPQYPDAGGEMFDGHTADPLRWRDPGWTGVLGDAALHVELDAPRRVDWVGVHVLRDPSCGIDFPARIVVRCDATSAGVAAELRSDLRARTGEYVIANEAALAAVCSSLDVELVGRGSWVFASEVEIVSERSERGDSPSSPGR